MSRIKGKNTKPELRLLRELRLWGLKGFRIKSKLIGKPDIVFLKSRVIIFVDGCFWHKCSACFKKPATNTDFWLKKINNNINRDKFVSITLKKAGWKVIRIPEHELRVKDISRVIKKINKLLNKEVK